MSRIFSQNLTSEKTLTFCTTRFAVASKADQIPAPLGFHVNFTLKLRLTK
ncbi:hypothetical protein DWUX_149 [Desulfovibrio diazotrophicus]|nr:hypothetical protein DWUX_149 [Desulfovibrio diazotrophicus]